MLECVSAIRKKATSMLAMVGRVGRWWHTEASRVKVEKNNAEFPHTHILSLCLLPTFPALAIFTPATPQNLQCSELIRVLG